MRPSLRTVPATTTLLRAACRRAATPQLAPWLQSSASPSSPPPLQSSRLQHPRAHSSVNATEISHFSALASSWWDPHGPSRPLHLMNRLRHDFIQSCLSSSPTSPPYENVNYLDVGCGGGIFAESAARLPTTRSVTAIDPSSEILTIARAHAKRDPAVASKLTYLNASIETLPPRQVDVVSCFEVIEHVDYPSQFLDRLGEFVRPGGWLVMSTIARTWTSWFTTNLMAEDILGMVPKGTHDWSKYINEHELAEYFRKDGKWGQPRVMGVVFIPGCGWKEAKGSEKIGNYFFGVQRVV